jgi:lysozyme
MTPSPRALALIKQFEGCKLQAYQDQGGRWTIGYGTTGSTAGEPISPSMLITQAKADEWLMDALEALAAALNGLITVSLSQNQFDALVCFVYNIGIGNFKASTLLKLLNQGRLVEAGDELLKWDTIKGQVSGGLYRRRATERELFNS